MESSTWNSLWRNQKEKQIAEAIGKPMQAGLLEWPTAKSNAYWCHVIEWLVQKVALPVMAGGLEMKQYLLNLERGIYYAAQNERIYPKGARMPPTSLSGDESPLLKHSVFFLDSF